MSTKIDSPYSTDSSKFQALWDRDPASEGHFFYGVISTMIFCRPTCSSRPPLRKNVCFCATSDEAISKGFIPCKRCKPDQETGWNRTRDIVASACMIIMNMAKQNRKPNIDKIAERLKVSKWHLCRTFKNYTGITPRQFYLKAADGKDPLKLKPLPLIQTKRNLLRLKQLAQASANAKKIDSHPSPSSTQSSDNVKVDSHSPSESSCISETPSSSVAINSPATSTTTTSHTDELPNDDSITAEHLLENFLLENVSHVGNIDDPSFNSELYSFDFDSNDFFSPSFMLNDDNLHNVNINPNDNFMTTLEK